MRRPSASPTCPPLDLFEQVGTCLFAPLPSALAVHPVAKECRTRDEQRRDGLAGQKTQHGEHRYLKSEGKRKQRAQRQGAQETIEAVLVCHHLVEIRGGLRALVTFPDRRHRLYRHPHLALAAT